MNHRSSLFPPPQNLFVESYSQGCELWQNAVDKLTAPVIQKHYDYPETPESFVDLLTQSVFIGSTDAPTTLVLIGGTHGIEGFAGTAVQCDLLNLISSGHLDLSPQLSVLAINALNPWGYHHLHRFDHQGIDVNRNFINFDAPLPDNSGFADLASIFGITDLDERTRQLKNAEIRMGNQNYEVAFSGGQYSDAFAPFYGGTRKSHSRLVIEDLMRRYKLANKHLAVIDVHTGLGPYGYGEVICDHAANSPGLDVAKHWYGDACTSVVDGSSSSVPKTGLLDYAWHDIMDEQGCFVTLEFGTLGTESLFNVLLDDTYNPHGKLPGNQQAMKNHFCPADPYWREATIFRSRQVISQAIAGLTTS